MRFEATHLRGNRYAIRPVGKLGTCGWMNDGQAWSVVYINARNAAEALLKFHCSRGEPVLEQTP